MKCLNPVLIANPMIDKTPFMVNHIFDEVRYRATYGDKAYIHVPCGKCEACITRKSNEWAVRIYYEWLNSSTSYFATLTYADHHLHWDKVTFNWNGFYETIDWPQLNKRDVQLFMKRLRKKLGNGVRFFVGAEYGENTIRPHYHLMLFNYPDIPHDDLLIILNDCWKKGNVVADSSTIQRARYCAKYCYSQSLMDMRHVSNLVKPFILCSRKPGIGHQYISQSAYDYHNDSLDTGVPMENFTMPMPRYYRDKIFTTFNKEKLFLKYLFDPKVEPTPDEVRLFKKRFKQKKQAKQL